MLKVSTVPPATQLRLWEKANTHKSSTEDEQKARTDFVEAVDRLHASQANLTQEEKFESLLERMRANVMYVFCN